jgi:oligopeptide/dipeptide ABC transporter, ATP-binding protein, C-terminal domain
VPPHTSQIEAEPLLVVKDLKKHFPILSPFGKVSGHVKAVNHVEFTLRRNETLGLVGESGCGKSTTGRMILRLIEPTDGQVIYKGKNIFELDRREMRKIRREMQMVFQDPYNSFNPKQRIGHSIEEPLSIHKIGNRKTRMEKAMELLHKVGLREDHYYRFPHEFSGGQRQRIGIARALALEPEILVCDEPVSALDVSIQSQVINLLEDLQEQFQLSYIFIAHDLSVVRHISDHVGVMYLGSLVEKAPTDELFAQPLHPYTKALLSSIPIPNPKRKRERIVLSGEIPSPLNLPAGCHFHPRCPYATERCKSETPAYREVGSDHFVACHLV